MTGCNGRERERESDLQALTHAACVRWHVRAQCAKRGERLLLAQVAAGDRHTDSPWI